MTKSDESHSSTNNWRIRQRLGLSLSKSVNGGYALTSQIVSVAEDASLYPDGGELDGARLWRRRLFEAEAGLTRFVAETRAGAQMDELLRTKQAIFEQLPECGDEAEWKAAFFRGQAIMEHFVVNNFGLEQLANWAATNSAIYAATDAEPKHDATVPIQRLEAQAALYDSQREWIDHGPERSTLAIHHCAIWDYREIARRRGVELTLKAPCEYCVPATTAMITTKGLHASHRLTNGETGPGCVWTASRALSC